MAEIKADITYLKEAVMSILNIVGNRTHRPEEDDCRSPEAMEEDPNGPIKRSARIANLDQTDYKNLSKGTTANLKKKTAKIQKKK